MPTMQSQVRRKTLFNGDSVFVLYFDIQWRNDCNFPPLSGCNVMWKMECAAGSGAARVSS